MWELSILNHFHQQECIVYGVQSNSPFFRSEDFPFLIRILPLETAFKIESFLQYRVDAVKEF